MSSRAAWILVATQLVATRARADPADDAPGHLERGIAAYQANDFVRAQGEFAAANLLVPDQPEPYRWLALTEAKLGDCQSAVTNVENYLSRVPANEPHVGELMALRDRCVHTGSVDVESTPPGATVRIDGGPIATTPAKNLAIGVGRHTLTVERPGYDPQSHVIEVRPFVTDYRRYTLTARPVASSSRRLYEQWWFWTAIGAAVVTGLLIANEASSSSSPSSPPPSDTGHFPPVTCDPNGCHP